MIYSSVNKIKASLLNSKSELSIIGTFQLVQDNITDLMQVLNIDGLTTRKNYNALWVVAKNRVKFVKAPFWNDVITVDSFVSNKSLVKINIDTVGKNKAGEICFYSCAELCAIDAEMGRIRKMNTIGVGDNILVEPALMQLQYNRFDNVLGEMVDQTQVRSTNIDYLHHCNNIEYLRFILNVYPEKVLSSSVEEMEVVYTNQSFEGDKLQVYKDCSPQYDCVYLKRGEDFVVKSQIVLKKLQ